MTLLSVSSFTALVAVIALSLAVRSSLRRIATLDAQRIRALETVNTQRRLLDALTAVLTAAKANLSACPACNLGSDEPCVCEARRQALHATVSAAEHAGGARDSPR